MKRASITAAMMAIMLSVPSTAANQRQPLEDEYFGWHAVLVDPDAGVVIFATPVERAGDAVRFHLLNVYRDDRRSLGAVFDKEVVGVLADCGSRMVLTTDYRYQKGDVLTPPPIIRLQSADVPRPGSTADVALTAVCKGDGSADQVVTAPYAWAKQRLRAPAK